MNQKKDVFKAEEMAVDILTAARRKFLLVSVDEDLNQCTTGGYELTKEETIGLLATLVHDTLTDMKKQVGYTYDELLGILLEVLNDEEDGVHDSDGRHETAGRKP